MFDDMETPLSINNLKRRVGIVHKNISWRLSWNLLLNSSNDVHSSIAFSSQNSTTILSTHLNKFVCQQLLSFCINDQLSWSSSLVMKDYQEIFLFKKWWILETSRVYWWKILLLLVWALAFFLWHIFWNNFKFFSSTTRGFLLLSIFFHVYSSFVLNQYYQK